MFKNSTNKRTIFLITIIVFILQDIKIILGDINNNNVETTDHKITENEVNIAVKKWAPLVLLAPGEQFMPSSVPYFLKNTIAVYFDPSNKSSLSIKQQLPHGLESEKYFLFTRKSVEQQLQNPSSFLYGQDPTKNAVSTYAVIRRCASSNFEKARTFYSKSKRFLPDPVLKKSFHVTYWFFYPFNEGKNVCTVSLGALGPVPIPKLFNKCLGEQQSIGSHVGDWEHMSLYFKDVDKPDKMYVSTHDAGVYYKFDPIANVFIYERQETREGILQKPQFPTKVYLLHGHPLLYSAKGSHGLWSKPGIHRYLTVPRLYDETGNGIAWKTWENLEIIDPPFTSTPNWLKFRGRWGNTKSYCLQLKALNKVGINICQLSDGPTGIPMKRPNFVCPTFR